LKNSGRVAMAGDISKMTYESLSKYAFTEKMGTATMMKSETPSIGEELTKTISEQLGIIQKVLDEVAPTPVLPEPEMPIEVPVINPDLVPAVKSTVLPADATTTSPKSTEPLPTTTADPSLPATKTQGAAGY
jgi:hypothetical protein